MYLYQPDASGDDYHWIQGIVDAECRSVIRPCPNDGGIAYAKGLGIALTLDEEKFIGSCPFLFGAVMADFFARYVSINSFAETSIQSKQRGELVRWPSYLGKRHLM
jgi:type VI secretion system protein ImpG